MECGVCDIRSSIGYCVKCQKLLCETCAETCDECGKMMCPDHIYESRSGKIYCNSCNDRRKAERKEKHRRHRDDDAEGDGSSLETLAGGATEAEEVEEEARVLGKRKEVQPWQVCLYTAIAALLIALLLFVFPSFRRIPLGGTNFLPTPYVLLFVPFVAAIWGVYGIVNIEFYKHRFRCMTGVGIAILSMVMFVVAVATDPAARQDEDSTELQNRRQNMNEQQLDGWRGNVLDRFQ